MSRNILSKLTAIALAAAFALAAFPAAAATAQPGGGPIPAIPALPPDDPDAEELGALPDATELISEDYPVWVWSQFYTVWLPMYGFTVYHGRLAVWWIKDWDGEQHTIQVVGEWRGETIDGDEVSEPFNLTWPYVDNAPWPLFVFGRTLFKWTPPALLKEASVEAYVYFDGDCVPRYCPYQHSVDYNRVIKVDPGPSTQPGSHPSSPSSE